APAWRLLRNQVSLAGCVSYTPGRLRKAVLENRIRLVHRGSRVGVRVTDLLGVEVQVEEQLVDPRLGEPADVVANLIERTVQQPAIDAVHRPVAQHRHAAHHGAKARRRLTGAFGRISHCGDSESDVVEAGLAARLSPGTA